jgi:putative aldouronate transport system substrate-binding protein
LTISRSTISTPEGYELRLFKATQLYDGFQPKETLQGSLFLNPADAEEYGFLITNLTAWFPYRKLSGFFVCG